VAKSFFREGGPHKIKRTGPDEFSMSIAVPTDESGFVGRECPSDLCSPGDFKVKLGTGITGGQTEAYCPYCRHRDEPSGFMTESQLQYAKDIMMREAHGAVQKMFEDALGLGPSRRKTFGGGMFSVELSYKPGHPPVVRRPLEEELRRDVVCPRCGLAHAVFGLATWCADCGVDIFMTHVRTELDSVVAMLGDVDRRRETLGARVAARDIENCLEDVVSIFEAAIRALVRRRLRDDGVSETEIEDVFRKKISNRFQSIERTSEWMKEELRIDPFEGLARDDMKTLSLTFEKRHPITHNLGIVDRKYLDKVLSGDLEGRDVPVTVDEIQRAVGLCLATIAQVHRTLFPGDGA
jgi:hypothetical protein